MLIKGYFYEVTRVHKWHPFYGNILRKADVGYLPIQRITWSLQLIYEN